MIASWAFAESCVAGAAVGSEAVAPSAVKDSTSALYAPLVMPYWPLAVISLRVGPLSGDRLSASNSVRRRIG